MNRHRTPYLSVTTSGITLMLGVVLNYLIPEKIFGYLLSTIVWIVLWVWAAITLSHFNYRRTIATESPRTENFRLPGAPYTNWAIISLIGVVALLTLTNGASRITFYIIMSWLGTLVAAYHAKHAKSPIRS